ncbi:DUF1801 domain-containing protein [Candidatus Saccharibacteria bacterium]|nr:DUF1801 domain-containing protein [Candidatus Saccharibacteria bacterium]
MDNQKFITVDDYIAAQPVNLRILAEQMRLTIHQAAPDAKEKISYGIPTFTLRGNLVHFAVYKTHVGFYPGAEPIKKFASEITGFKTSKGTIQFPLDKPLPLALVTKITKFRAQENAKNH